MRHTGARREPTHVDKLAPAGQLHHCAQLAGVPCQDNPDCAAPQNRPAVFCTGSWWLQLHGHWRYGCQKSLNTTAGENHGTKGASKPVGCLTEVTQMFPPSRSGVTVETPSNTIAQTCATATATQSLKHHPPRLTQHQQLYNSRHAAAAVAASMAAPVLVAAAALFAPLPSMKSLKACRLLKRGKHDGCAVAAASASPAPVRCSSRTAQGQARVPWGREGQSSVALLGKQTKQQRLSHVLRHVMRACTKTPCQQ